MGSVRGRRATTVEDVAARAGVSVATVSRALRGLPNVADSTRQRVELAAAELSYRPDPNASRLAAGRTHCIGVAVPTLGSWYHSQVLAGAEAVLAPAGYDMLVYTAPDPEDPRRFLGDALPATNRVDGLILVDLPLPGIQADRWAGAGASLVTVGQRTDSFPSVGVDDRSAAAEATRHLLNLGHRDVGFIGVPPEQDPFRFDVPQLRRAGYDDAMAEHGLTPRPEHLVAGRFTVESGRQAMDRLLAGSAPPTAVLAISDEMAIGALQSIRQHGRRVPEDISVVGFDDHEVAEAVGLTTVRQPVADVGGRAASLLLDELAAGEPLAVHVELPTMLVVRSTTCPRRG